MKTRNIFSVWHWVILVCLFCSGEARAEWQKKGNVSNPAISDGNWSFSIATNTTWGGYTVTGYSKGAGTLDFTTLKADTGYEVTALANGLFNNNLGKSSVTNVILPGVRSIGSQTFKDNPVLRDCRAPSLESLGNSAFRNCSVLTNVTVGSHCTNLGYQAFVYCAQLRTLTPSFARGAVFPDGTQGFMQNCYEFRSPLVFDSPLPLTFAQNAFQNLTNLTQVVFKSRVQSMDGAWCFQGLKQAVDFYFYGAAPESVGNDVVKGPNNRWVRFYVNRDYADTWTNLLEAGNPGLGDHPGEKTLGKLKNNNVWVVSWRVPTKGLLLLIR